MRLHLDQLGRILKDHPKVFYRVSTWATESRVADFTTSAEAHKFAIADTKEKGLRFCHKVSCMRMV